MSMRVSNVLVIVTSLAAAGCTLDQATPPALTGPSTFATSVSVTANPDVVSLGQSATLPGQHSQIIVSAFDANGQPKANQTILLDTVVNGQLSGCGQLSVRSVTTGSDGLARAVFTAPGTPPNCLGFNADGTVGVRATPVGSQASIAAASTANILMMLPTSTGSEGAFTVNFTATPSPTAGEPLRFAFDDAGSVSPGHAIPNSGFRWDWSDGATKIGPNVTHDFPFAGTYTATLTITDDIGQSGSKTALLTVR